MVELGASAEQLSNAANLWILKMDIVEKIPNLRKFSIIP